MRAKTTFGPHQLLAFHAVTMAQAILVVDDSVTSRMITQATLSDAGWSVVLSTDGAQALKP